MARQRARCRNPECGTYDASTHETQANDTTPAGLLNGIIIALNPLPTGALNNMRTGLDSGVQGVILVSPQVPINVSVPTLLAMQLEVFGNGGSGYFNMWARRVR